MNLALTALDVAIGLSFVYLLVALMCSVVQELIANVLSWRGKHLRDGIKAMLNDPNMATLAKRVYAHPRVAALSLPGALPSYIPSTTFAKALVDIIAEDGNLTADVSGPLRPFIRAAAGDADKLEADLAEWFDQSMDRLGGWYKRNIQIWLLVIGLIFAASLNIDSPRLARALWTQPLLRDVVTQSAQKFYDENTPQPAPGAAARNDKPQGGGEKEKAKGPGQLKLEELERTFNALDLPIGWTSDLWNSATASGWREGVATWVVLAIGWLITALASSLGTQFWFQTLGEALSLRAAGRKPKPASDPVDDKDAEG